MLDTWCLDEEGLNRLNERGDIVIRVGLVDGTCGGPHEFDICQTKIGVEWKGHVI